MNPTTTKAASSSPTTLLLVVFVNFIVITVFIHDFFQQGTSLFNLSIDSDHKEDDEYKKIVSREEKLLENVFGIKKINT